MILLADELPSIAVGTESHTTMGVQLSLSAFWSFSAVSEVLNLILI